MVWGKKDPYEKWLEDQAKLYASGSDELSPYYPQALENQQAVKKKAMESMFEATQQGAPQRFVSHGGPKTKYASTAMFPAKSMPVSDPGRLQATPVGYDKEPWWRQSPYVSPRQPGYSIFSMKPYSW